ncbi:uncharacterized protein LOC134210447 [Armigeres subalbatus]|uniref:uncharacterized protein LOC134210447 n=1 Tax=Armigeres subalbatus TaxID=124917 RepID=UPI002ED38C12
MDNGFSLLIAAAAALDTSHDRRDSDDTFLFRDERNAISFLNVITSTPKKEITKPEHPLPLDMSSANLKEEPLNLSLVENQPLDLAMYRTGLLSRSVDTNNNVRNERRPLNLIIGNHKVCTQSKDTSVRVPSKDDSGKRCISTADHSVIPKREKHTRVCPYPSPMYRPPVQSGLTRSKQYAIDDRFETDSPTSRLHLTTATTGPRKPQLSTTSLISGSPKPTPKRFDERCDNIADSDSLTMSAISGIGVFEDTTVHVTPTALSDDKCIRSSDTDNIAQNLFVGSQNKDSSVKETPTATALSSTHAHTSIRGKALKDVGHSAGTLNDEEDDDAPIGDATFLDMFSIEEYFEPYHNHTIVGLYEDDVEIDVDDHSGDDENGKESNIQNREERLSRIDKSVEKGTDVDYDMGFQEISQEEVPKQSNACCNKVNQLRKVKGLSYRRSNGSTVPARNIKAPCKCAILQCYAKYSKDLRNSLLSNLLKLSKSGQNQFISNHISSTPVASSTVVNSRRSYTRKYFLPGVGGMVRVCKTMFLSTLDICEKKARCLAEKKIRNDGVALDDRRCFNTFRNPISKEHMAYIKNHIESFPSYSSHYGRAKSTKKFLSSDLNIAKMYDLYAERCAKDNIDRAPVHYNSYRLIFKTYNLSFRKPKVDTCDTCDKFKVELSAATNETIKNELLKKREDHHRRAKLVYDRKRQDVENAKNDEGVCTVSFDLQKCLPTPHLTTGRAYYSRQLYTYNLTVFVTHHGNNAAHCYLWDETKGRRGSQEIGSCVYNFILSFLHTSNNPVRRLNLYSDRCSGQNHNFVMCMMLAYVCEKFAALEQHMIITHNFMVSGHSHMEVDSIHSAIERAKKTNTMDIEIPRDWSILISQIRRRVPIKVIELDSKDLLAIKDLSARYKRPKLNASGELLNFQQIMTFEYRTDTIGKIFYKIDPMVDSFLCFQIGCESNLNGTPLPDLVPITLEPLELPSAKLEDLRSLLPYVKNKQYYQAFLKTIVAPKRGRKKKNLDQDCFEGDLSLEELS